MSKLEVKPMHKPVQTYYAFLPRLDNISVSHKGTVKSLFQGLLDHQASRQDLTRLIERTVRTILGGADVIALEVEEFILQ